MVTHHNYCQIVTVFFITFSSSSGLGVGDFKPEVKIVGGLEAYPAQFPYQVSLRSVSGYSYTFGHFCGGSILNDRHILTAAHCLYRKDPADLFIVAGALQLTENGQRRSVQSYSIHSLYSDDSYKYDIGIIKLYTPLDINNYTTMEISLQLMSPPAGTVCTVSGWGQTQEEKGSIPNTLRYVDVPVADWVSCVRNYSKIGQTVPEAGMLCAGFSSGGRDACSGDSGGPLVCEGKLTGVVSWGAGCAEKDLPGVYSDVSFYQKWVSAHSGTIITIEYRGFYVFIMLGYVLLYLIKVG